jgi:hypothetical protein
MLLANWFADQFCAGIGWMMLFIAAASYVAKKFGNNNPEIKDAAKKAATTKAISLIARLFK